MQCNQTGSTRSANNNVAHRSRRASYFKGPIARLTVASSQKHSDHLSGRRIQCVEVHWLALTRGSRYSVEINTSLKWLPVIGHQYGVWPYLYPNDQPHWQCDNPHFPG